MLKIVATLPLLSDLFFVPNCAALPQYISNKEFGSNP
jgi:hypothetical protein